jgi:hypothetical protein
MGLSRLEARLCNELHGLVSTNLRLRSALSIRPGQPDGLYSTTEDILFCSLLVEGAGPASGEYHLLQHEHKIHVEFVREDENEMYSLVANGGSWLLTGSVGGTILFIANGEHWPPPTNWASAGNQESIVVRPIRKSQANENLRDAFLQAREKSNQWYEVFDQEMGTISYLNWNTGVTQWEKPAGSVQALAPDAIGGEHTDTASLTFCENGESPGSMCNLSYSLLRCTIELTPTAALTPAEIENMYSSIASTTPALGGVVSWLGYKVVPFAYGLHLIVVKCAVTGSGYAVCEDLEKLPEIQAVRFLDEQTMKYGEIDYWDQRYADPNCSSYDWLLEWEQVCHLINRFVARDDYILQAGVSVYRYYI